MFIIIKKNTLLKQIQTIQQTISGKNIFPPYLIRIIIIIDNMDNTPTILKSQAQSESTQIVQSQQKVAKKKILLSGIPQHIVNNSLLSDAITILPPHYNFEIYKTLYRIETLSKQLSKQHLKISLQFPQGLMLFACVISDIIRQFAAVPVETVIMGDVTYGACCVDDLASDQMDCDLLVHYGHSCLVPITDTKRKILYVFVQIQIDIQHFVETVAYNFAEQASQPIYILGTIQFNNSLFLAKQALAQKKFSNIIVPQQKPRSAGQVLGCTSPKLQLRKDKRNIVVFLCDGRFHMEATMIANPEFQFYQYSPYSRELTEQKYATKTMIQRRSEELGRALKGKKKRICFIFGALGRQGNTGILERLVKKVEGIFQHMVLIASEVNVKLLTAIEVDFFVQIACPRLSIDWSYGTPKPLLTPFELYALIDKYDFKLGYNMDYYSYGGGPWTNFFGKQQKKIRNPKNQAKIKLQIEQCCKGECVCGKK